MKFRFPSPYTVLMLVIILAAAATWLVPAGSYDTLSYEASSDTFIVYSAEGIESLPARQETLKELDVSIDLEKFRQGDIRKPVSLPGTYRQEESAPQGILAVFLAPIKGMYDVIDIVMLVLVLGGFIGVFNNSGALDDGVAALSRLLSGKESLLIIVCTVLMAIGGTTFGMAEETLAFYPILVPVFIAAGYDLLVPLAVVFAGSNLGVMASTINPFSTIIASDAAGINWTVGFSSRLAMLLLGVIVCIWYIVRYGEKVRKNPGFSFLSENAFENPFHSSNTTGHLEKLDLKTKLLLLLFGATFLIMITGVAFLGWWLEEMTVLFLISAILMAFLQKTGEQQFIKEFMNGARDLLGVCFIIGIARGVTIIMNDGKISDTILFHSVNLVQGMSGFAFLPALMIVFFVMAFFISSTSGLAVVSMPIMSSLAPIIGIPSEEIVNAYLFGMGLMLFITPTSMVLPSLSMVNVNYDSWLKFILPLMGILAVIAVAILWLGLII